MPQATRNLSTDYGGNLATAAASGEAVLIPAGYWDYSSDITFAAGTRFIGTGQGKSILRNITAAASLKIGSAASTLNNMGLYGLTVEANVGTPGKPAIDCINAWGTTIDDVGMNCGARLAIDIGGGSNNFNTRIDALTITSAGIGIRIGEINGLVQDLWITRSLLGSCSGGGIVVRDVSGLYVSATDVISCLNGMSFEIDGATKQAKGIHLTDVLVDTSDRYGFIFFAANGARIGNVNMNGCWAATQSGNPATSNYGTGLVIGKDSNPSSVVSNFAIDTLRAVNNKGSGILIGNGENITLDSCTCTSNGQQTANTYDGLVVEAAASRIAVNGGTFGGNDWFPQNQRYGIRNASNSTRINSSVNVSNNMTGGILDTTENPF